MNNKRRTEIDKLIKKLDELKTEIEALQEEEQECYDNMPENLQDSERGEAMQNAIDNLEYAVSSVEEAIDYLTEAAE